tara:strand:+ start:57 stop:1010 length:954 start_codon:yes stop_codon:yes gene_type:complete
MVKCSLCNNEASSKCTSSGGGKCKKCCDGCHKHPNKKSSDINTGKRKQKSGTKADRKRQRKDEKEKIDRFYLGSSNTWMSDTDDDRNLKSVNVHRVAADFVKGLGWEKRQAFTRLTDKCCETGEFELMEGVTEEFARDEWCAANALFDAGVQDVEEARNARGKSDQELLTEIQQSSMYKEDETAFIEDKEVTTNDPDSSLLNWYHQVMIPTKRAGAAYWQQIIGAPLLATKINQYLQSIHLHQAHQSPGFNCSNMFKGGYKAHGVGVSQSTLNDKWHHHWDDGEEYYTNAPFDAGCKFDRRVESEDESEEEDDSDEE